MAEKKRKHIGLWAVGLLFLITGVLFFSVAYRAARDLPRVTEFNRSRLSPEITFSAYEKMPQISFPDHLAVSGELQPETLAEIGEVKPVLVNEHFFEVYRIHVGGSAVTEEHVAHKTPAVVISSQTARRMSLDGNAVGKTIALWNSDFTVVGVYQKPAGLLRGISSDIYDRVYVPYTCYEGYAEVCIDSIAASKGTYSEKAIPLLGITGSDIHFYIENNLTVKHDMLAVFPNWFIALLALILFVTAVRILKCFLSAFFRKLREDYQKAYFWAVVRRRWRGILLRLFAAAALLALPVVLWICFPVKLILPPDYIPVDNLFDVGHYWNAFTKHTQTANANLTVGNGYYAHLFSNAALVLTLMFVLLTVLSVAIAVRLHMLVRQRNRKPRG